MNRKAIVIDDQNSWIKLLCDALNRSGFEEIQTFDTYTKAERGLRKINLKEFDLALIDVRMRPPVFDQGGLALLDSIKKIAPDLPTIILTEYAQDYPGLKDTVERYPKILIYRKNVFLDSTKEILEGALLKLPPQIGEMSRLSKKLSSPIQNANSVLNENAMGQKFGYVLVGFFCLLLILGSGLATFALLQKFKQFSSYGNVLFALVVVCLMAVLIGVFGKDTIQMAIHQSSSWLKTIFNRTGRK